MNQMIVSGYKHTLCNISLLKCLNQIPNIYLLDGIEQPTIKSILIKEIMIKEYTNRCNENDERIDCHSVEYCRLPICDDHLSLSLYIHNNRLNNVSPSFSEG